MSTYAALPSFFTAVASALRTQLGNSDNIVANEFPEKIAAAGSAQYSAGVTAARVGTASAADVYSGKTFTNSTASEITGTMSVQNTWTWSTYTGSNPLYGINGSNFYMKFPANRYWAEQGALAGYSYTQIPTTCFGEAAVADVKSGATFTSTAGVKKTGTFTHSSTYNVTNKNNSVLDLTTWHDYRYLNVKGYGVVKATATRGGTGTIKMSSPYSGTGQLQNYSYYKVPANFYVTQIAVMAWHISMNAYVDFANKKIYCRVDNSTWSPTLTPSATNQTAWNTTNYGWYRGTYNSSYLYPNSTAFFPDNASTGTTRMVMIGEYK